MDGNSTMSVGQLLSTHSGDLFSISQIFLAAALVYFTSKYANLVNEQNKMMLKNRDYGLIVKKYNRMLDEMDNLVALLYSSRNNPNIFAPMKIISNVGTVNGKIHQPSYENYTFWENIEKNMYLSQSSELNTSLEKYLKSLTYKSDPKKMQPIIDDLVNTIERRHLELRKTN